MHPYLVFILGVIFCVVLALAVGQFLGISNKRCYAKESNQGRLRLDDCDNYACHKHGECQYAPRSLPSE